MVLLTLLMSNMGMLFAEELKKGMVYVKSVTNNTTPGHTFTDDIKESENAPIFRVFTPKEFTILPNETKKFETEILAIDLNNNETNSKKAYRFVIRIKIKNKGKSDTADFYLEFKKDENNSKNNQLVLVTPEILGFPNPIFKNKDLLTKNWEVEITVNDSDVKFVVRAKKS